MELLKNFGTAIVDAFEMIASSLSLPLALVELVPPIIGASITIVITVMIVKLILGR